jgi:hypothetical protein
MKSREATFSPTSRSVNSLVNLVISPYHGYFENALDRVLARLSSLWIIRPQLRDHSRKREFPVKRKNAIAICSMIIAGLLSASCESVFDRDRGRYDGREAQLNLTGTWYVNGDRDKRAEIVSTPSGLEARNERGDTSRLVTERDGDIRALDWEGGLRGDTRPGRIDWPNGTTWTREPSRR